MFAPYCETCRSRILLSTRSIVQFFSPDHVILACVCGNHVDAFAPKPGRDEADQAGLPLAAAAS